MRATAAASLAAAVLVLHAAATDTGKGRQGVVGVAQDAINALDALKRPPQAAGAGVGSKMRFSSRAQVAAAANTEPSGECAICEDVVQTWRETFPCSGAFEPDWTPDNSVVRARSGGTPPVAAAHEGVRASPPRAGQQRVQDGAHLQPPPQGVLRAGPFPAPAPRPFLALTRRCGARSLPSAMSTKRPCASRRRKFGPP